MIRKSISVALCFSTVLSSISWSMDAPKTELTLSPLGSFYIDKSHTQETLNDDIPRESGRAFVQGAKKGFSAYVEDTKRFLRSVYKGDFSKIGEDSLRELIQQSLETNLRKFQERNQTEQEKGDLDADSIKELFALVRGGVYQALLRTGAFGSPRKIFIAERNVTETHYDVTLGVAASFLKAILPNTLPLRGVLISLINNSAINTFLMNQIDAQFARLTVRYFERITGLKLTQTMLNAVELIGLSGVVIGAEAIKSALTDYDNVETLPSLAQETQPSFSALWNYINPRLSHYIREGIIESVMGISGITADKISDPVGLAVTKTIHNHSKVITGAIGLAGYSIGESLTSVPFLDGALVAGSFYWASNGLLQAALPRGIDDSRKKFIEMVMNKLRLTATYYVNQFLPVTSDEHRLYGLNPIPSQTELDLFRDDYEGRDLLNQQGSVAALVKDLASAVSTPLSILLEASGLQKLAIALLGSEDTTDGLALLTSAQGHAQAKHHDTVARIKLFELAKALSDIENQRSDFSKTAPWYSRALAYWNGTIPDQLALTTEQQELLDTIRKHPSFELLKAELDHLAKHYTWLSQEDQSKKLKPYEESRHNLSAEFTQNAIDVLDKIKAAKAALNGKVNDVDTSLSTLMNNLCYEHFILALDAILDPGLISQFDFISRPITELPAFAIGMRNYSDLLSSHKGLVRLIQTSSLGMNKTLTEQLDLAKELSTVDDAETRLKEQVTTVDQSIAGIESQAIHERYQRNILSYLGYTYGQKFLDQIGTHELDVITTSFDTVIFVDSDSGQGVSDEYVRKCLGSLAQNDKFKSFRAQIRQLSLGGDINTAIYQYIIQELIHRKIELDRCKTTQSKTEKPKSWFPWFSWSTSEPSTSERVDSTDWILVSDGIQESTEITQFNLPALQDVPLETFESQGFEAYFVAKTIKDMIVADSTVFEGRSPLALTDEDMLKVAERINHIRRSHVILSDDLMVIDRYQGELASLVQRSHGSSVIWTYDTLLAELKQQVSTTLQSVRPVSDSLESGSSDLQENH